MVTRVRFARMARLLIGFALATAPLLAQAPATADPEAALARALESVRTERIVADVFYVACDDMGGRDTPSTGQRLTARFIKNRLQRLGWKPGAKDGWMHTYPLSHRRVKEPETRAVVQRGEQRIELEFGRDYFFNVRDLEPLDLGAGVVYCGRGSKDELASAAAVKGKWALCVDPGDGGRAIEGDVRANGAVGMVLMQPHGADARGYEEGFGPSLMVLRRGRTSWPDRDDPRKTPFFPRVYLARDAAARLLALAGAGSPGPGEELPIRFSDTRRLHGNGEVICENVCGWWPGSDPVLKKEAIIISAHYDHVGIGSDGQVFNGADDNGSGTCGLLALAEALVFEGPLRRSVLLLWVSGEEIGLYGSQAWSAAPWLPGDARAIANINVDMIGRNTPDQILVTPSRDHTAYNGLTRLAERFAADEGFTRVGSADAYYNRSDQANFAKLGIPVTFLFSDIHEDYHRPTDDPEKLDGDKVRRTIRLILRMLSAMQDDDPALVR